MSHQSARLIKPAARNVSQGDLVGRGHARRLCWLLSYQLLGWWAQILPTGSTFFRVLQLPEVLPLSLQPPDCCWPTSTTQSFSEYISILIHQYQDFQITPQGRPLFCLEAFTWKIRLIGFSHETVQAFAFQLSVSRYLLPVITSPLCRAAGKYCPFCSPKEPDYAGGDTWHVCMISPSLHRQGAHTVWGHGTVTGLIPPPPGSLLSLALIPSPAHQSGNAKCEHQSPPPLRWLPQYQTSSSALVAKWVWFHRVLQGCRMD